MELLNTNIGYWENPQRVARYYNFLQTAPKESIPPWIDAKAVTEAYQYLQFRNNGKPWQQWGSLDPSDPGSSFLKGIATPPVQFLLPNEADYAQPKLGNWKDLQPLEQFMESLVDTGTGMVNRPAGSRLSAALVQGATMGLMVGVPLSGLTPFVGVPVGVLVGLGIAYQAYTGKEIPILSNFSNLMSVPINAVEKGIGTAAQAFFGGDVAFQETTHHFLEAWQAASETYNTMSANPLLDIVGALEGKQRQPGYVWRWDLGLSDAQQLEGGKSGINALTEIRDRIIAGENPADVYNDFNSRFGIQGQTNDLVMGMLLNPYQIVPYLSTEGAGVVADITNNLGLKDAYLQNRGNFIVDSLPLGIGKIVEKVARLADPDSPLRTSGGLNNVIKAYRIFYETGDLTTLNLINGIKTNLPEDSYMRQTFGKFYDKIVGNTTGKFEYYPTEVGGLSPLGYFDRWVLKLDAKGVPNIFNATPKTGNPLVDKIRQVTNDTPKSKTINYTRNMDENIGTILARTKDIGEVDAIFSKVSSVDPIQFSNDVNAILYDKPVSPLTQEGFTGAIVFELSKMSKEFFKGVYSEMAGQWKNHLNLQMVSEIAEIAKRLGKTPEDALIALAKGGDIVTLLGGQLPKGLEGFTNKDLAGRFSVYIRSKNALPATFDEFKVQVGGKFHDYAQEFAMNRFGFKGDPAWTKLSNGMKYIQGLLVLGLNPRYLAYNVINNFVTQVYEGFGNVLSPTRAAEIMTGYGIDKFIQSQNFNVKEIGKTSFIDAQAIRKAKGITDKLAVISNLSHKAENAMRLSTLTQAYAQHYEANWNVQMPDSLKAIAPEGLDPTALEYKLRGIKNGDFSNALSSEVPLDINQLANDVATKYASINVLTTKDPTFYTDLMQKVGVLDEIKKQVADGVPYDTAIDNVKANLSDMLYNKYMEEIKTVLPDDIQSQAMQERLNTSLRNLSIVDAKFYQEWIQHFVDYGNLKGFEFDTPAERNAAFQAQQKIDANRFSVIPEQRIQVMRGILQGMGIDPEAPAAQPLFQNMTAVNDLFKLAFEQTNKLKNDYFTVDKSKWTVEQRAAEWQNVTTQSDAIFMEAFTQENYLQSQVAPALKQLLADHYNLQVGIPTTITKQMEANLRGAGFTREQINNMTPQEAWARLNPTIPNSPLNLAIDSWTKETIDTRVVMQNSIKDFRDGFIKTPPMDATESRARWSQFITETYQPLINNLLFKDAENMAKVGAESYTGMMFDVANSHLFHLLDDLKVEWSKQAKLGKVINIEGATPEFIAGMNNWLKNVERDHTMLKYSSLRHAKMMTDAVLLDYNRQTGFDSYMALYAPYAFWATHTAVNWMIRMMNKPAMLTNYLRYRDAQTASNMPGMPSRLNGKIRIPIRWLPSWMGGGIWIDPLTQLYPPAMFFGALEQVGQQDQQAVTAIQYALSDMVQNNEITQTQMDEAMRTKSGDIWNTAVLQASKDADLADPATLASIVLTPAMWWDIPRKLISGKADTIPLTPLARTSQSLATDTGIGALGLPAQAEQWMREKVGMTKAVARYGQFGDYYIDRQISDMIAEGIVPVQDGLQAMNDHQGDIYNQAIKRVDQEIALKSPMTLPILEAQNGAPPAAIASGIFFSLFPDGLLPEGELILRKDKLEMNRAWDLYQKGDSSALTEFYDKYPEYAARTALFAKPEERLRQFLVGNIWDTYNSLSSADRKLAASELGQDFKDTFLSGVDPAVIDVTTLALWARIIGGMVPQLPEVQTPQVQQAQPFTKWSPETSKAYQLYVDEREKLFPNYYALTQAYYNEGVKLPGLQEYFDWNTQYKATHPEISAVLAFTKADNQKVTTSLNNAPPELISQLQQYFLLNYPLTSGAWVALDSLWRSSGMPDGSVDNWLKVLKSQFAQ
jgi:hypothetical protein